MMLGSGLVLQLEIISIDVNEMNTYLYLIFHLCVLTLHCRVIEVKEVTRSRNGNPMPKCLIG